MTYEWGDLISLEYGKPVSDKKSTDGKIPVFGTNGQIGTSHLSPLCPKPSFVVGRKGAYRGVHYSKVPFSVIDTAFYVKNLNENVLDTKWAYYKFLTYDINSMDSGSAIPSTDRYEIYKIEVDLPDIKVQRKVVGILSSLDDKIEINNKIIKNLENQLVCLFNEKCTTKGQLSSSVVQSLSDIATFTNGLAMQKFPPESDSQFLRVLKIKELRQGYLDESSDKCSANIEEKFKVNDGDVIFSWSGSLMVDLWTGGVCGLNQHLFKVTSDLYPKWFVYMWVKHHVSDFAAIAAAKATTMGHIKRGDLDKAQVVVPNDECMKTLTKIFDPLLGLLIATKIQNKKLSKIRDMLLPKLISGEIELKNQ